MKILLINKYHFLRGGAERAYFDMARMLEGQGHQVAFFSMDHPDNLPTPWSRYFVKRSEYGAADVSFPERLRLAANILWSFEAERKLEALLRDFQPDIAHVHNAYHQLSPSIFRPLRRKRVPVVMTLHDYKLISPNYSLFVRGKVWDHTSGFRCIADRCVKDSYAKSLLCALELWLHALLGSYRHIAAFISPSRFLIAKFREHGFSREIFYLPNPLPRKERSVTLPREEKTLLFFGRLSAEKGADVALEALALLPREWSLRIAGDGPERENLQALSAALSIDDRVTFLGALSQAELESYKKKATAVLLPSLWYENFPYALIESLQSGCLVIASDQGGFRERIRDGENGLLFKAGDAQSLVQKILSADQPGADLLRENARKSVEDLTEERFLSELISIYKRLAAA